MTYLRSFLSKIRQKTTRPFDKGYILVVVLGFLMIVSAMIVDITQRARLGSSYLDTAARLVDQRLASEAAISVGLSILANDLKTSRSSLLGEPHDVDVGPYKAIVSIEDEGGKLDVNYVSSDVLFRLLQLVGFDSGHSNDIVAGIMDLRSQNQSNSVGPSRNRNVNGTLVSLEELLAIDALSYEEFQTLTPYLTVYSGKRQVNPWSASEIVLKSLKGADESQIEAFIEERGGLLKEGSISFASGSMRIADLSQISIQPGPTFTIRADLGTSESGGFVQERLYWMNPSDPKYYKLMRVYFPKQQKGQAS